MKTARIRFTNFMIAQLLGLPEGAVIRRVIQDYELERMDSVEFIVVGHDGLPDVAEGDVIPTIGVEYSGKHVPPTFVGWRRIYG